MDNFKDALARLRDADTDGEETLDCGALLKYKAVPPEEREMRKRAGDFCLYIKSGGRLRSEKAVLEHLEKERAEGKPPPSKKRVAAQVA